MKSNFSGVSHLICDYHQMIEVILFLYCNTLTQFIILEHNLVQRSCSTGPAQGDVRRLSLSF